MPLEQNRMDDLSYGVDAKGVTGPPAGREIAFVRRLGKPVVWDSQSPAGTHRWDGRVHLSYLSERAPGHPPSGGGPGAAFLPQAPPPRGGLARGGGADGVARTGPLPSAAGRAPPEERLR